MKNILLITVSIISISLSSCSGNSTSKDDFSSAESAANSYFNVLKEFNKDEVKSILLTFEEFKALKESVPGFAADLPRLGETDQAQYEGVIAETMADYSKNFETSAGKLFLNSKNLPGAKYLGAEIKEENFNGLTLAPIFIKFKVESKSYEVKLRAVKVNDNWKAVYFGPIQMAR